MDRELHRHNQRKLNGADRHGQLRCFLFQLRQPLLKLLKRDDVTVALLFLFSGFLASGIEAFIGDSSGIDPSKPPLVFLAVSLEYRIIRLLLCPLPESASLTTDLLPLGDRPLTILCTDSHQLREPASAVLFFANCGYLCGQPFLASFNCVKKFQKTDKNTGNLAISGVFMVETTGLEPVTSCV